MRPFHIRPATAEDIPAVHRLLVETWHDTYDTSMGAAKVEAFTTRWHAPEVLTPQLGREHWSFLVAVEEDEVVGHAFGGLRAPTRLHIARLYILPRRQRRGIGRKLIAALLERYPQARGIELEVEAENLKGIAFYAQEGFMPTSETTDGGTRLFRLWKLLKP